MTDNEVKYRALIGLHGSSIRADVTVALRKRGFEVQKIMDEKQAIKAYDAHSEDRHLIVMEANLCSPGEAVIEPARQVYAHVKSGIDKGLVRFLAVSLTKEAVDMATNEGIPAEDSTGIYGKVIEMCEDLKK